MSSAVIRFEVTLPCPSNFITNDSNFNAIFTFINSLQGLAPCWYYPVTVSPSGDGSCWYNLYGYITAAQGASAIALLNTLNSSLSAPWTPVKCVQWSGTQEP